MVSRQTSRMSGMMITPDTSDRRPDMHRQESTAHRVGRKVKESVADFFGVGDENVLDSHRWTNRRLQHASRKFGRLKEGIATPRPDPDDVDGMPVRYIHDPLRLGRGAGGMSMASRGGGGGMSMASPSMRSSPLSSVSTYNTRGAQMMRKRKQSVMSMTWKGVNTALGVRNKLKQKSRVHSRSYAPASVVGEPPGDDASIGPVPIMTSYPEGETLSLVDDVFFDDIPRLKGDLDGGAPTDWRRGVATPDMAAARPGVSDEADGVGMRRIANKVLDSAFDNSSRRQIGMGFVGRLFSRSFRTERLDSTVKMQIDDLDDHRPYFTYWITFVQVVIFIVSLFVYGVADIGVGESLEQAMVMKPNLVIVNEGHKEIDNLWIGPNQAALIHLGAKYSPCMRRDTNVYTAIEDDRTIERNSSCCVFNDGTGCYQTTEKHCKSVLTTFVQSGTKYGNVCGQDPIYCKSPPSVRPFEWGDDITKWPVCTETANKTNPQHIHMRCELTGHPCCYGIQGECIITTREHCNLRRGYYHDDKFLCSQVPCLSQICGMIGFADPEYPDQFYRLWTSLFLHGGLFHLVITLAFQILVMRDVEKLAGAIRITIIYMGSGIAGNVASAIFLPYQVEIKKTIFENFTTGMTGSVIEPVIPVVGPAGCQFGILACLMVEILQTWQLLASPWIALAKIGGFILILFLFGLLPWIDNYAHLFGFIFGLLIAFALLPYVSFGEFDKRRKIIGIFVSLLAAGGMFALLCVLFYVLPIYQCIGCQYFNCIPFNDNFCKNMEITVRETSYLSVWA